MSKRALPHALLPVPVACLLPAIATAAICANLPTAPIGNGGVLGKCVGPDNLTNPEGPYTVCDVTCSSAKVPSAELKCTGSDTWPTVECLGKPTVVSALLRVEPTV